MAGNENEVANAVLRDYVAEPDLAAQLGLNPRTLARWRRARTGPPFTQIGREISRSPEGIAGRCADCEFFSIATDPSTSAQLNPQLVDTAWVQSRRLLVSRVLPGWAPNLCAPRRREGRTIAASAGTLSQTLRRVKAKWQT